jgi:hydroxymethylpyrimidine pyrophosphatase-like HAD family hydrolase
MLTQPTHTLPPDEEYFFHWPEPLAEEREFYSAYEWGLDLRLTLAQAVGHLREELAKFPVMQDGWQVAAVASNAFLLSCAVLNATDEYLRGPALQLPKPLKEKRIGRAGARLFERLAKNPFSRERGRIQGWRTRWAAALDDFLVPVASGRNTEAGALAHASRALAGLLDYDLPARLESKALAVPSPFSRLDLTEGDVIALANKLLASLADRSEPVLLVGLRTSGSYFAPLVRAVLQAAGCARVSWLTIEPNKGPCREEEEELDRFARSGHRAVIVDDPPHTASTVLAALAILRRAGFEPDRTRIVAPTHPAKPNWAKFIPEHLVVTLAPERWHKRAFLEKNAVERQLAEYFYCRNSHASVVEVSITGEGLPADYDRRIASIPFDERSSRLKRVFEVELRTADAGTETIYVLAKSVGWGWFSYAAFLAGARLEGFVPPVLGLRDGILYMAFYPQGAASRSAIDRSSPLNKSMREAVLDRAASYVAARVDRLRIPPRHPSRRPRAPRPEEHRSSRAGDLIDASRRTGARAPQDEGSRSLDLGRQDNGIRILEKALSRAYGSILTDTLMRSRLRRSLRQRICPFPTLIDGNMLASEWVESPSGPLKCDYEHHGMGKAALNLADPAYDVADTILNLALDADEERQFLARYAGQSGDIEVGRRLFIHKLLAGLWSMKEVQDRILLPCGTALLKELHERFMRAWHFLTIASARYCGSLCFQPAATGWRPPLVALDVDGVIDRRLFGFPCTTAAGIEALSLLHAHDVSVVVNTARSVSEVKAYCEAYSLAGGIAEHGAYVWDAVYQQGRPLISADTVHQFEKLRRRLRELPGVFLDDRHRYSVRAFMYRDTSGGFSSSLLRSVRASEIGDGALGPLPSAMVQSVMQDLELDRLSFHHTTIDTTFVAREADKGSGLLALRNWVLGPDAETIAVGDHPQDLSAFRAATRSFAPANINCAAPARLLGCRIAQRPYQAGLLEIVRAIVHPDGATCERCVQARAGAAHEHADDLFLQALRAADRSWFVNLAAALFDRSALKIFVR